MQTTANILDRWKLFADYELYILQESMNAATGRSNIRSRLLEEVNKEVANRLKQHRKGLQDDVNYSIGY